MAESLSVLALAAILFWAVVRPFGWPEAVAAVPAAALVTGVGALSPGAAAGEMRQLGPVVGFLAAVLVLARLCDDEGLFRACGAWLARASGGSPRRLLLQVFAVASVTTAVLSLDATVVLLTPVVYATAVRLELKGRPHLYACTHLANSASLLLPVSNLTNLLALAASGLAFGKFAGLMALPWLAAIGVEYLVFRRFFAADLPAAAPRPAPRPASGPDESAARTARGVSTALSSPGEPVRLPRFALAVVALTLAGFVVTSLAGIAPAWAAAAGAAVLAIRGLARRQTGVKALIRSADIGFLVFVLALGVVVKAVTVGGLGHALGSVLPGGTGLPALLAVAAIAAVLANVINNLPAVLVLLPLAAPSGPGAVLAVLIGVNIGPNLTYTGSLATLLWRRVLRHHGSGPSVKEFTLLGLLTVPAGLAAATVALWAALRA